MKKKMRTPWGEMDVDKLSWDQVLAIQNHQYAAMRTFIFIMSLCIAVQAIASVGHRLEIVFVTTVLICFTYAYSMFTIYRTNQVLRQVPEHAGFTRVFYATTVTMLFILYVVILITVWRQKKSSLVN